MENIRELDTVLLMRDRDHWQREYDWAATEVRRLLFKQDDLKGRIKELEAENEIEEGSPLDSLIEAAQSAGRLLHMLAAQGRLSEGGEQPGNAAHCNDVAEWVKHALKAFQ